MRFPQPREISFLESHFKNVIQTKLTRGSINCNVNFLNNQNKLIPTAYNENLLQAYLNIADNIKQTHPEIQGNLTIEQVMNIPDLITFEQNNPDEEQFKAFLTGLLNKALDQLLEMRKEEGEKLVVDIQSRLDKMQAIIDQIDSMQVNRIEELRDKLKERVEQLMDGQELDETRLIQEASILADKIDVNEEIVRFRAHIQACSETLKQKDSHGKKLNFMCQELLREANTLGNKSNFAEMSQLAVSLKEEIESIREQVLNIE